MPVYIALYIGNKEIAEAEPAQSSWHVTLLYQTPCLFVANGRAVDLLLSSVKCSSPESWEVSIKK